MSQSEEPDDLSFEDTDNIDDDAPKAKKSKGTTYAIYGSLFAAGLFGWLIYNSINGAAAPQQQHDPVLTGQMQPAQPAGYESVVQPIGQPIDATGMATAPADPMAAEVVPVTAAQVAGQPAAAPMNAVMTSAAPAQVADANTKIVDPSGKPVTVAQQAPAGSDAERIKQLEDRVAKLEARLNTQRDRANSKRDVRSSSTSTGNAEPVATKPKAKPASRKSTKGVVAATPQADAASADVKAAPVTPVAAPVATGLPTPKPGVYMLAAAVPGRAHLQAGDGGRMDVAVGDAVPGCGRVSKIDADVGEVQAGSCVIR